MNRQGAKLSATAVNAASKPGLYGDGHGLYLQVSKYGTKSWVFRYMINGVARKMGMGAVHTVSLKEARKRAAEWRLRVHDRVDPIEQRKAARSRQRVETARAITFKQCADAYIAANRAGWRNAKHAHQWFATFNETRHIRKVFPAATLAINDLPVSATDTGLVLKVLEPLWTRTPETASRIRGRIELVLDAAKVRGLRDGENPARWRGHLDKILPARSRLSRGHHDAVPYVEMPAFMAELRSTEGLSARALEFTILTAARTSEVIGSKWSEFDLATKLWTIPAARMKGAREHRIPLEPRAIEILAALPRDGSGLVFGRLFDMATMLKLARAMRKGTTVHGFRSSFRDWAAEQTSYPNELCEIALAHAVSGKAEAAYRRGDQMEKRRRLMADWAAYCEGKSAEGDNVVRIRESA